MSTEDKKIDDQNNDDQNGGGSDDQNNGGEDKKLEVTPEEYAKLQELEKNRSIENKRKSEENKILKEKLDAFEAEKKKLEEGELKKKGKYEELLAEKDKTITDLTEKATNWDSYSEKKTKEIADKLETLNTELGDEVLSENAYILEDLSDEKKVVYLEKIKNTAEKAKDFDPEAGAGKKIENNDMDKAKASGNPMDILKAARK